MSWRKNMGVESKKNEHFNPYPQKPQKVKKKDNNNSFEAFESIEAKNQKVKTLQNQIDELWTQATKLADWIDDPDSEVHWKERTKYVPEVLAMGREIDLLKAQQINPVIERTRDMSCPMQENRFMLRQNILYRQAARQIPKSAV